MAIEINGNQFRGKSRTTLSQITQLSDKLRRRKIVGSNQTALETALLLRLVVSNAKFSSIEELLAIVEAVGQSLLDSQPKELAIINVTRKVLKLIREEYQQALRASNLDSSEPALRSSFMTPNLYDVGLPKDQMNDSTAQSSSYQFQKSNSDIDDFNRKSTTVMIQAIQEVIDEIETTYEQVSKNASNHIKSTDVILTIGKSKTAESFIKSAATTSGGLMVYVAENAPLFNGKDMVKSLEQVKGVKVIMISDSTIYSLMPRITKVVIGTHVVLSNGGIIAETGTYLTSAIAGMHATPVICVTGQFKITSNKDNRESGEFSSSDYVNSGKMIKYDDGRVVDRVDVGVPYYEYVKPEMITVFITNDGEYPPMLIRRLIDEEMSD
ncbi:hypothetical protein E3P89_03829 [Wallemia ichthyophaga]|uniref:Translation initiation factor eIF2B subunit beta n=1 Tax=Wallemia ichthyophaga TaxID=245174 RepID=A0A4T0HVU1_WALIC|nr:hypothetical protein E3P93_03839 [Wallemia ichthyophaga]TIB07983.1 hypothetical protein E3P90_03842 [Wallemia ichthyophaga]TIB19582.1 hypothetical protein E3P89_03829 [Wallemia ichthyophaga]TIB20656.1 hypothetical protein E3P88_03835 [Wallemia ichthyophaga]